MGKIENAKQKVLTERWLGRFTYSVHVLEKLYADDMTLLHKAEIEGMKSQIESFLEELTEYDKNKTSVD